MRGCIEIVNCRFAPLLLKLYKNDFVQRSEDRMMVNWPSFAKRRRWMILQAHFEATMNRAMLLLILFVVWCFTSGLCEDIKNVVLMSEPTDLEESFVWPKFTGNACCMRKGSCSSFWVVRQYSCLHLKQCHLPFWFFTYFVHRH